MGRCRPDRIELLDGRLHRPDRAGLPGAGQRLRGGRDPGAHHDRAVACSQENAAPADAADMANRSEMLALVCVGALAACAHTSTYGYQSSFDKQFLGNELPEQPPVEARQLLSTARTIAFFPPDSCINSTSAETQQDKVVRARCGVLLSRLERDAERAGYEVVSWVNLRGNQRPIDYAREAKVDVLFEINELSPQRIRASESKRKLAFFDRDDSGVDHDLAVSGVVGRRCYEWAKHSKDEIVGLNSTLDIKTVSVADGRARWHYRRTVSTSADEQSPKVRFVGASQPNKVGQTLLGSGLGLILVGVVFAVVDEAVAGMTDPSTGMTNGKSFGDLPYYLIAAGGIAGVAGLGITTLTGQSRPAPEDVLCLESHSVTDGIVQGAVVPQTEGATASHQMFNETTAASPDEALAALIEKLAIDRVSEFVAILTEIHHAPSRGPAPPAPLPPSAAPPARPDEPNATPVAAQPPAH
jgi:hypothetical protein